MGDMRVNTPPPSGQAPEPIWYAEQPDRGAKLAAALRPKVVHDRLERGRRALEHPSEPLRDQAPAYFHTYVQLKAAMRGLQKKYPNLVHLDDIGDSGEKTRGQADRDILKLRIGSKKAEAAKAPKVLWLGGIHAREIANPDLLMQWVETILKAYGKDPEATALLDSRILDVVPLVNPDGHAQVEKAYSGDGGNGMQRKNTTPPDGTDINRNFSFHWGGPGAGTNPYSETYRGKSAASEPETQAVEKLIRNTDYHLIIDWHSYSELVLYPWGDTHKKPPDYKGLKAVAEAFASLNGYTPEQSIDLYPTTGTSDGPGYGEKRIPSFTVETGRSFHQSDAEYARVKRENFPVMTYSLKIADKPYERAEGPSIARVRIDAKTGRLTAEAATAVSSATLVGFRPRSTMVAAEYVLDPSVPAGEGTPLVAADGRFDTPQETLTADIDHLRSPGRHQLIYVRGRDSAGHWGPLTAQFLPPAAARQVA